jgi:hypothetical protein
MSTSGCRGAPAHREKSDDRINNRPTCPSRRRTSGRMTTTKAARATARRTPARARPRRVVTSNAGETVTARYENGVAPTAPCWCSGSAPRGTLASVQASPAQPPSSFLTRCSGLQYWTSLDPRSECRSGDRELERDCGGRAPQHGTAMGHHSLSRGAARLHPATGCQVVLRLRMLLIQQLLLLVVRRK